MNALKELTNYEVFRRYGAGDNEAALEFDNRYRAKLLKFALKNGLARDTDEAKDIVQETFIRAFEKNAYFKEGDPTTWLHTVEYNLGINFKRKEAGHFSIDDVNDKSQAPLHDAVLNDRNIHYNSKTDPAKPADILEDIMAKEINGAIARALERLEGLEDNKMLCIRSSKKYAEAFRLHYFYHFDYSEIAEILNMCVGTVKSQIHRAKDFLRNDSELIQIHKEYLDTLNEKSHLDLAFV